MSRTHNLYKGTGASDAYTTSFASLKQELVSITDKQFPEQIKSKIDGLYMSLYFTTILTPFLYIQRNPLS